MQHQLELSDDGCSIVKFFGNSDLLRIERQRTIEAIGVCESSNCVSVPSILGVDTNSITFAYCAGAIRFSDVLINDFDTANDLAPKIAKSLVYLQKNLRHNETLDCPTQLEFTMNSEAYVHGDFSVHNLLVQDGNLILVDWSSTSWVAKQFNYAPIHWDLAWFVQSIYLIPPIHKLSFSQKDIIASAVLRHYLELGKPRQNRKIAQYCLAHHDYFFKYRLASVNWYSSLKHYPEWFRCRRFWKKEFSKKA